MAYRSIDGETDMMKLIGAFLQVFVENALRKPQNTPDHDMRPSLIQTEQMLQMKSLNCKLLLT
jgi:hypothetical protein